MVVIVLRFKVADFKAWLEIFTSRIPMRRAAGCMSSRAFEAADEPGTAVLMLEWDSRENYERYAKTGFVQNFHDNPMILDEPDIYVLEERANSEAT